MQHQTPINQMVCSADRRCNSVSVHMCVCVHDKVGRLWVCHSAFLLNFLHSRPRRDAVILSMFKCKRQQVVC